MLEAGEPSPCFTYYYGMSYTDFKLTNVSANIVNEELVVKATVTNIGSCAGKEVVQVYMAAPDGLLEKPSKELKGYAKTDLLNPGQSQSLTIKTPIYWLTSYYEALNAWILDAGLYEFYVGTSVKQVNLAGTWNLPYMRVVKEDVGKIGFYNGREAPPVLSKYDSPAQQAAKLQRYVFPTPADPSSLVQPGTATALRGRYPGDHWMGAGQDDVPTDWVNWTNTTASLARNQADFTTRRITGGTIWQLIDVYNGARLGDANWDDALVFDVNGDGIVDLLDIAWIIATFIG